MVCCRIFLSATGQQKKNGGKKDTTGAAMAVGPHEGSDHSGKTTRWKRRFFVGQHQLCENAGLAVCSFREATWHV